MYNINMPEINHKEMNPPELEQGIGILCYKSRTQGIGGRIKQVPEDFIVEEIMEDGKVLEAAEDGAVLEVVGNGAVLEAAEDGALVEVVESIVPKPGGDFSNQVRDSGEYVHFTLQKGNWETLRAVREISRKLGVSRNRLSFAGTKDKRAVTTQRVSVWNVRAEDLQRINIKDMQLRDFLYADDRIELGHLLGNRFTITIRNLGIDENSITNRINLIKEELKSGFPNFFGVQRFGTTRPITHLVGGEIIRKDFREAVMLYLTKTYPEESEDAKEARGFLRKTEDFKSAIKRFPKKLGYENSLLNYLVKNPGDFKGALRSLPKKLGMMFIHAYQSYIFNRALSRYIREEITIEKLPLPGYETELDEVTAEILSEEEISREDFRIKIREFSSKGIYRECFIPFENFSILARGDDELNPGTKKSILRFSLKKGSYATTLLREFMKNEYWV